MTPKFAAANAASPACQIASDGIAVKELADYWKLCIFSVLHGCHNHAIDDNSLFSELNCVLTAVSWCCTPMIGANPDRPFVAIRLNLAK